MAVCRQTPDDPGSCGVLMPKNCECLRACYRLMCAHGTDTNRCAWRASLQPCSFLLTRCAAHRSALQPLLLPSIAGILAGGR